ncbi:ACRO protein, partial [Sitta europaea]|nr:ACRO protein [Sitta europaea]
WPGIVSVQATMENGTWHMCSGALIQPRWVLTVAHCFVGARDISRWQVVIGATDLSQPGPQAKRCRIKRILRHQNYDAGSARNNIALLELEQPLECSDYIQLGCVPGSSLAGCHSPSLSPRPCVPVPIPVSPSLCPCPCPSVPLPPSPTQSPQLPPGCGRDPTAAPDPPLLAQGDSGGPLVCRDPTSDSFWLVGLASWGRGCVGTKRPGIFTSTQHFHTWIQVQLGLVPPK